jgi:outer membrane protein TolC
MKNILAILLCLAVNKLTAQGVLTFEQAVQKTLANNFDIRIVKNTALQAENNNNPGNAGYLPTIGVTADQFFSSTNTRQEFYSGQINEKQNAQNRSLNAAVRLDWTFFDGFTMFATDKRLQIQEDQAALQVRAQIEMQVYQTAVLYYSLVLQNQMTKVYQDALDLSRERYNLVVIKEKNGALSSLDLLQAKLDMNTDSSNLLSQNKIIRDLKTELALVMGEAENTHFDVVDEAVSIQPIDRKAIETNAISQNTSILLNKSNIALVDAQRKEMQGRYYPQLGLYGQYSVTTSQSQVGLLASNRSLGPGFGITLSWTILDQLSTFTTLKNLDLTQQNAELMVEQQNQVITKELNLAFSNYDYAQELFQIENASILNTEEIFEIARQTYEAGSMTDLELREIQFSIVQAKNRQLSSALALKTAQLNLSLLSGDFQKLL